MADGKWTPGPWTVDGPPWNQIVWSSAENRVCFLSHTNGLDDERDIATGRLIAAAPDLVEAAELAEEVILAVADEIPEFVHSARMGSLRSVAQRLRSALSRAGA